MSRNSLFGSCSSCCYRWQSTGGVHVVCAMVVCVLGRGGGG